MNLVELDHPLRELPLSAMATVLETWPRHAQTDLLAPLDLQSVPVSDKLLRRHKQARF